MNRTNKAFELFDSYNRQDPHTLTWDGIEYPAEYFFALQLHKWVNTLRPQAGEALQLASRCQHIGRWKIPRDQYPAGKAGYLRWRNDLAKFHADEAGKLLSESGYTQEEIKAVRHILVKENLKTDDEVQLMEDALCLVFLQFQYEDFANKHEEEKILRILRKTWKKMSAAGRDAASSLVFGEKGKALLVKALNN